MIGTLRTTAFVAVATALILGSTHVAPAASMRHVDYRLSSGLDGGPGSGTVRLDFVAAHGGGAVTVDVADDDAVPVRAKIDRSGHIETVLDQTLSEADLALLNTVALETENLNGVEVGDQWMRTTRIPGGRATMQYKVTRNDDRGHVALAVARTVDADGDVSTWRGTVEYDANSFVPTAIALTGRVHSSDDPDARPRALSVSMKLVNDTFARGIDN
jgi:hypothetical protein